MTKAEGPVPDQSVPDQSIPDQSVRDQSGRGQSVSDPAVPDRSVADPSVPDRQAGAEPSRSVTTGGAVPGQAEAGQSMAARPAPGQAVPGRRGADRPVREAAPNVSAEADAVLPSEERDKLQLRVQHAVGGFVDEPRAAVEEAAAAVDALTERVVETLAQRRGTLRASWQDASGGAATEDLRLALRAYRRLAERLLSL
ncbi:hypothetical protein ACFPFX_28645 [Streptomyces mauvecolor]|uniref:Uncharacterized protein n=1 Tax=Streptomyces mauvecolor TaxID=58345 RepID=A0ABV9UTZ9_9ACTN